ncbi:MAG: hypothetical protein HY898_11080 [Deltaproteobacteria bacterium]|nr:hypothetical protein [Deltaproteobacteria bacterium]
MLLLAAGLPLLMAPGACGNAPAAGPKALAGCNRSAASKASASAAPSASILAVEDADGGAALPFELDRGCASDIAASLEGEAQLQQLGSRCAPGMSRVLTTGGSMAVTPTQAAEVKVNLGRNACVRVGVAAQPAGTPMEVVLVEPGTGAEAGRVKSGAPLLLGRDGPVCVREAGAYVVRVRSLRGAAQAWVGAWASQAPAPNSSR